MRRLIYLGIIICLFYSCREKTTYEMRIIIESSLEDSLNVKLFPKAEFMEGHSSSYHFMDIGGGSHGTEFDLGPNEDEILYYSSNLDQEPWVLTSAIFDSIHIKLSDQNSTEIKFSPDTVVGYKENIFDTNSTWSYQLRNDDLKTNFSGDHVESHEYTFEISNDK